METENKTLMEAKEDFETIIQTENKTLEETLKYFVENIKETQKNGYKLMETIYCLIDLHINSLTVLEQIGDDEIERSCIKALIYKSFAKRENERLKALRAEKGESHE